MTGGSASLLVPGGSAISHPVTAALVPETVGSLAKSFGWVGLHRRYRICICNAEAIESFSKRIGAAAQRLHSKRFKVSEEQQIARAILRYLDANPEAQDTVEGISQWWVRKEWVQRKVDEVENAIRLLKGKGFILEEPNTGVGRALYRLNPDQREAVRMLLKNTEQGSQDD